MSFADPGTICLQEGFSILSSCASRVSLTFGGFIDGAWVDGLGRDKRHETGNGEGNYCVEGMHFRRYSWLYC